MSVEFHVLEMPETETGFIPRYWFESAYSAREYRMFRNGEGTIKKYRRVSVKGIADGQANVAATEWAIRKEVERGESKFSGM